MLLATLWLEGAVTWQPGDHISTHVRMCCSCEFVHVFVWVVSGEVWGHFLFSTAKHHTLLRPQRWQVQSVSHAVGLSRTSPSPPAPHPLYMLSLSPFPLLSVSAGRVSLVRITTLRLEGLQLDDQGLYECRILYLLDKPTDERRNGTWTLLSVTGEVYGGLVVVGLVSVWSCICLLHVFMAACKVDYI